MVTRRESNRIVANISPQEAAVIGAALHRPVAAGELILTVADVGALLLTFRAPYPSEIVRRLLLLLESINLGTRFTPDGMIDQNEIPFPVMMAARRVTDGCGCGHGGSCGHDSEDAHTLAAYVLSLTLPGVDR